jgi:hypothetical protein
LVSEPWTKPLIPRKGSPIGGSLLQNSNNYHLDTNPGEKRRRSTIVSATDAKPPIALSTPEFLLLLLPRLSPQGMYGFFLSFFLQGFVSLLFFLSSSLPMPIIHNKKVF